MVWKLFHIKCKTFNRNPTSISTIASCRDFSNSALFLERGRWYSSFSCTFKLLSIPDITSVLPFPHSIVNWLRTWRPSGQNHQIEIKWNKLNKCEFSEVNLSSGFGGIPKSPLRSLQLASSIFNWSKYAWGERLKQSPSQGVSPSPAAVITPQGSWLAFQVCKSSTLPLSTVIASSSPWNQYFWMVLLIIVHWHVLKASSDDHSWNIIFTSPPWSLPPASAVCFCRYRLALWELPLKRIK